MRVVTLLPAILVGLLTFGFTTSHASEPFALKWSDADPHGITVQIDTTLPDNAEVRVSVSRAYDATSEGKRDTYSRNYFSEDGTVSDWREPRRISVNDDAWVAELKEDQDQMAKISADLAFEVDSVDPHIEITAYAYAHKSGERYGAREYDSLVDKVHDTERVGKQEIRIMRPMTNAANIQKRSIKVSAYGLEAGYSYRLIGEDAPLAPTLSGGTLEDLVYLPAGTVVTVIGVDDPRGYPSYHVSLPDYAGRKGWIRSIALLPEGVEHLTETPQILDQQAENTQGHLPEPCAALNEPPPEWFHCPTPYVELVRTDKNDGLYARAWHCRETGHSLATFPDHEGCAGGRHMLVGWELPAESIVVAQTTSLRDEIIEHVIDPCYLDMVQRNRVEGVSDQQMLELLKLMQVSNIEKSINALMPVVSKAESTQARALIYELGKQTCIQAARSTQ